MEECIEVWWQLIKISWVKKCVRSFEAKSVQTDAKAKCKNAISEVWIESHI
jgi:hypothetical protein